MHGDGNDDPGAARALAEAAATSPLSGEKRLLAAVLGDAMHAFMRFHPARTGGSGPRFREVQRWIESRDKSSLGAFETICEVLGIDASCLRRTLEERALAGAYTIRADGRGRRKVRL
jgi:hypothetical protein